MQSHEGLIGPKPEFYISNGLLKPYHDVQLAINSITDLKLGPRCDHDLNPHALILFAQNHFSQMPSVSVSAVNYRGAQ